MNHRVRLIIIAVIIFAWAGLLLSRLYVLQVEKHDYYVATALSQHQSRININPPRGTIYDRYGKILAINIDVPSIHANPRLIENPEEAAEKLAPYLQISPAKLKKSLSKDKSFIWLRRKVDYELKETIEKLKIRGIGFVTESKRFYPGDRLLSHVLGFTGIDNNGQAGVELSYEKYLRGTPGSMVVIQGGKRGYNFSEGQMVQEPLGGHDLRLTINSRFQNIVEEELKRQVIDTESVSGTVVAIDPFSGEILAMANYPDYNPNHITRADTPYLANRAVQHAYEPGSTFKLVTAAAAFEAGVVAPEDEFDCLGGSIKIGSRTIRDHKPFFTISFRKIIENSSNVGTIKVAELLGERPLWEMATKFGYGTRTGIDLPAESRGILRKLPQWSANSYGSIAIGQEVSANPTRILMNVTAVANGGYLVKPYVVSQVKDLEGNIVYQATREKKKLFSQKTANILKEFTRGVVTDGGGKEAAVRGFQVAGKTGTGEIAEGARGYIPGAYLASFGGYFPADKPKVAMICMLVKPQGKYYGGQVGAPLFARIAHRAANELEIVRDFQKGIIVTPVENDSNLTQVADYETSEHRKRPQPQTKDEIRMPDVKGMDLRSALKLLIALEIVPEVTGSGEVVNQIPAPGEIIEGKVELLCSGTTVAQEIGE